MSGASSTGWQMPSPWSLLLGADDFWRWSAQANSAWLTTHAPPETVARLRDQRLRELLAHARASSPFFRERHRGIPEDAPLDAHPPTTRAELMAAFDDWVTDPAVRRAEVEAFISDPARLGEPFLGRYAVWTSSGTTGVPGIYVVDPDALAVYEALLTARFSQEGGAGSLWQSLTVGRRLAMVAAVEGHFAGVVSWERLRRIHPWIGMHSRAFSILQPLGELVSELNDWQPAFVSSYPTMLALLAREQEAGRLRIRPEALWSGGEGLPPAERAEIQRVFGCRVLEEYGSSECMSIAFGCSHDALHVNADWVIVEAVDEKMRPVPPGQPSVTTLITNLANRVQPIIRYDLGDSVTLLPERCGCGCPLPAIRVEGRRDDVLCLERPGHRPVRLLPLAVETVIEERAGVHRFQVLQTGPAALAIRLDLPAAEDRRAAFARVRRCLGDYLAANGVPGVTIRLDPGKPEADPVSGKLRQVKVLPSARPAR